MNLCSKRYFMKTLCQSTTAFAPAIMMAEQTEKRKSAEEQPPEVTKTHHGQLTVHCLVLGKLAVNCYFISDRELNCVVIDPGAEAEAITGFIAGNRLKVKAWLWRVSPESAARFGRQLLYSVIFNHENRLPGCGVDVD